MIVDDNFISREHADFIENKIFSRNFTWNYSKRTSAKGIETVFSDDKTVDCFQLVHMFYSNGEVISDFHNIAKDLFTSFINKNNIEFRAFIRGKCNLVTRPDSINVPQVKPDIYMVPHVDFKFEHNVFLYYVNNTEGDTVFFGKEGQNKFIETDRLSPQKGRAAVFDGKIFHAPGYPYTSNERCVINISFV